MMLLMKMVLTKMECTSTVELVTASLKLNPVLPTIKCCQKGMHLRWYSGIDDSDGCGGEFGDVYSTWGQCPSGMGGVLGVVHSPEN